MKKQKFSWLFLFLQFSTYLAFLLELSKGVAKQGKGAGKEEFPEHWIFLLLLATPHNGTPKRKMEPRLGWEILICCRTMFAWNNDVQCQIMLCECHENKLKSSDGCFGGWWVCQNQMLTDCPSVAGIGHIGMGLWALLLNNLCMELWCPTSKHPFWVLWKKPNCQQDCTFQEHFQWKRSHWLSEWRILDCKKIKKG